MLKNRRYIGEYNYLYWEGDIYANYDLTKGFCVKGEDTAKFLEDSLEKLGLNRKEANEFIVYWLPLMQNNRYNIISFQTNIYTDAAKLNLNPSHQVRIKPAKEPYGYITLYGNFQIFTFSVHFLHL